MWVTKLLIFPVEIRIFCPKTTKFGPKLAFLVNLGQAMQAYSVPCWWVGWWLWRAGCISQDIYLLYNYYSNQGVSEMSIFSLVRFRILGHQHCYEKGPYAYLLTTNSCFDCRSRVPIFKLGGV